MIEASRRDETVSHASAHLKALRPKPGPEIIDEGIQLARQNYGALVVATLLPQLPDFGIDLWNSSHRVPLGVYPTMLVAMVLASLGHAAAARVAMDALEGLPADAARALRMTLRRTWAIVLAAFSRTILALVGAICLVIPGIYLLSVFALASALPVLERNVGGWEALRRSGTLTEGARGLVFGAYVVPYEFLYGANLALGILAIRIMGPHVGPLFGRLLGSSMAIAFGPFLASIQVRLYVELRMRREALDIEWALAAPTAAVGT